MSTIFISHSSTDNEFAGRVNSFLSSIGHRSVFLDFDPQFGIPAGRSWEKELYNNLRKCQVFVVLVSAGFTSSTWCFAEITHARALGKFIIPLKIDDCTVSNILLDVQVIDATKNLDEAFVRLENGLLSAGIVKEEWDSSRPPYPGLMSFKEEDAPIFFGREDETENLFKTIRQFRSFGGPKFLLVLGASGSGKSSLIKAGLIPQLVRDKKSWLVVGPMRPFKKPFEELSKSISKAFRAFNEEKNWKQIHQLLINDAENSFGEDNVLLNLLQELIELSEQEDPTVLIFIDQLEELVVNLSKVELANGTINKETLFLDYLSGFVQGSGNNFLVIATLRSDFLGNFQEHKTLKGVVFNDYLVKNISTEGLKNSITGPAKVAGLELEEGLVDVILTDIGTADALPLLAFTLRQLWEQYGAGGVLKIEDYKNKLGGLEGSVARVAEAVLIAYIAQKGKGEIIKIDKAENKARLDNETEVLLKAAFMVMVRIDEEGRYTRRFTLLEELPKKISDLLQSFVSARLLITSGDGREIKLEVAHEALFRTWERLVKWLDEDRNFLLWRKRLNTSLEEWIRSGKSEAEYLRGPSLGEAVEWLHQHKEGKNNLTGKEVEFINLSYNEAQKQRLRKIRNLRLLFAAAIAVIIFICGVGLYIYKVNLDTQNQLARTYWNSSQEARNENNQSLALLYSTEAMNISNDRELQLNLLADIQSSLPTTALKHILPSEGAINSAVFSADGQQVLTTSNDSTARLWNAETGQQIGPSLKHNGIVITGIFNSNGSKILTASWDFTACLWDATSGKKLFTLQHSDNVTSAVFSPDGKHILTASWDGTVQVWNAETGQKASEPIVHESLVTKAVYSPDGKKIFSATWDGTARLSDAETGRLLVEFNKHTKLITSVTFSSDGEKILTAGLDRIVQFSNTTTGAELFSFLEDEQVNSAVINNNGDKILIASNGGRVRILDALTGVQTGPVISFPANFTSAVFNGDNTQILTAGSDGAARLWDASTGKQIGHDMKHESALSAATFSPDGKRILTAGSDKNARIWQVIPPVQIKRMLDSQLYFGSATFTNNASQVLTAGDDGAARLWNATSGKLDQTMMHHPNLTTNAILSPDGLHILTINADSTAKIWNANNGQLTGATIKHTSNFNSAFFNRDKSLVITTSNDSTVRIWNAKTGKQSGHTMLHTSSVNRAEFSPDEKRIITIGSDSSARVWITHNGKQHGSPMKHDNAINAASFSADSRMVLTAGDDGTARVWDAETGKLLVPVLKHEGRVSTAVFSANGKQIVTASDDGTARLWETATGKQIGPSMRHQGIVQTAEFSANDKKILTASTDSTARIWETGTSKQVGQPLKHNSTVKSASFSADGKTVLTLTGEGNATIWSIEGDLDLPKDLFILQTKAYSALELNTGTGEVENIKKDRWYVLREEYNKAAREHYRACKYKEHNLWRRFNIEEANKIAK